MAHNQLREVPARVFSHLTQLNSLELDGNQITHVDPDAFIGLEGKCNYDLMQIPLYLLRACLPLPVGFCYPAHAVTPANCQHYRASPILLENIRLISYLEIKHTQIGHILTIIVEPINIDSACFWLSSFYFK